MTRPRLTSEKKNFFFCEHAMEDEQRLMQQCEQQIRQKWTPILQKAFIEFSRFDERGLSDIYTIEIDALHKLTYNGSHYMFYLPREEVPPALGIPMKMFAQSHSVSAWAMEYDFYTNMRRLQAIKNSSAIVSSSCTVEAASDALQTASPIDRVLMLTQRQNVPPWEILGVDRRASDADVKDAYRKLTLQVHPDKCSHPRAGEMCLVVRAAFLAMCQ